MAESLSDEMMRMLEESAERRKERGLGDAFEFDPMTDEPPFSFYSDLYVTGGIKKVWRQLQEDVQHDIEWNGPELTTNHLLVTCITIKERLKLESRDYDRNDQDRDPIDIFILVVFHLGYEQAMRRVAEHQRSWAFARNFLTTEEPKDD